MAKKVIVRKERRLLDAFFKVDEAVLRHERRDGSLSPELSRLHLERGDGVAALLYRTDEDRVVLMRQFRYPAWLREGPGWILEIVAGMLKEGEDPQEAIRRESHEETGYRVAALEPVSAFTWRRAAPPSASTSSTPQSVPPIAWTRAGDWPKKTRISKLSQCPPLRPLLQ